MFVKISPFLSSLTDFILYSPKLINIANLFPDSLDTIIHLIGAVSTVISSIFNLFYLLYNNHMFTLKINESDIDIIILALEKMGDEQAKEILLRLEQIDYFIGESNDKK